MVFAVNELDRPQAADELLTEPRRRDRSLLRGERQTLSEQESASVLAHRISYLADDLVVPDLQRRVRLRHADRRPGGARDPAEFANSQLLEFRHYDELLDDELDSIYGQLQQPRWDDHVDGLALHAGGAAGALAVHRRQRADRPDRERPEVRRRHLRRPAVWPGRRSARASRRWKADVEGKLKTLDDIYRFAVEQSSMSRGQFLELTVVVILVLELMLILMGVMK